MNGKDVALDEEEREDLQGNPIMEIDVCMQGDIMCIIKIREQSTLRQLRMDMQTEGETLPEDFQFVLNQHKAVWVTIQVSISIFGFWNNIKIRFIYYAGGKKEREFY